MRVCLHFDASFALEDDALYRSWFLVKPSVKTVADLSALIVKQFDLSKQCPHGTVRSNTGDSVITGIQLYIGDFVLPSNQDIELVKESDVLL